MSKGDILSIGSINKSIQNSYVYIFKINKIESMAYNESEKKLLFKVSFKNDHPLKKQFNYILKEGEIVSTNSFKSYYANVLEISLYSCTKEVRDFFMIYLMVQLKKKLKIFELDKFKYDDTVKMVFDDILKDNDIHKIHAESIIFMFYNIKNIVNNSCMKNKNVKEHLTEVFHKQKKENECMVDEESTKFSEKFNKKFDEKFEERLDENFETAFNLFLNEKFDEKFDEKFEVIFDNVFNSFLNDEFNELFNTKIDEKIDKKINQDRKIYKKMNKKIDEEFDKRFDKRFKKREFSSKFNEKFDTIFEVKKFEEKINEKLDIILKEKRIDNKLDIIFKEKLHEYKLKKTIFKKSRKRKREDGKDGFKITLPNKKRKKK